jgi:hypothetical protein
MEFISPLFFSRSSGMTPNEAYADIVSWASRVNLTMQIAFDPKARAENFAKAIASLRLKNQIEPEEPSREAIRAIMLDYLAHAAAYPGEGDTEEILIGRALEELVQRFTREAILAEESKPYRGCGGSS